MEAQPGKAYFGPIQIGIILTTLTTAFIHWYLILSLLRENRSPVLFFLNGLGYLVLLVALFLPQAIIDRFLPARMARLYRPVVRYTLIGYTLLTITLWAVLGPMVTPIAIFDKLTEAVLIGLLWLDRKR